MSFSEGPSVSPEAAKFERKPAPQQPKESPERAEVSQIDVGNADQLIGLEMARIEEIHHILENQKELGDMSRLQKIEMMRDLRLTDRVMHEVRWQLADRNMLDQISNETLRDDKRFFEWSRKTSQAYTFLDMGHELFEAGTEKEWTKEDAKELVDHMDNRSVLKFLELNAYQKSTGQEAAPFAATEALRERLATMKKEAHVLSEKLSSVSTYQQAEKVFHEVAGVDLNELFRRTVVEHSEEMDELFSEVEEGKKSLSDAIDRVTESLRDHEKINEGIYNLREQLAVLNKGISGHYEFTGGSSDHTYLDPVGLRIPRGWFEVAQKPSLNRFDDAVFDARTQV